MAHVEYTVTDSSGVAISRAPAFTLLSPVPHLFRTPNVAPTTSEAFSSIDNIVDESDRHLSQFAQSIAALQSEISRMQVESELVQVFKNRHLAMKAPIHRCPPEILSEIFLSCLPYRPGAESHTVPLLLSHICKGFRAVAIRTPALWASVYVNTYAHPDHDHLAILTTSIKRSASTPLHVTIAGFLAEDGALTQLISSSPRWISVKIDLFQEDMMCESLAHLQGASLPRLEHASIAWHRTDQGPRTLGCFKDAKQLHSVEISAFHLPTLALPWAQLTHLKTFNGGDITACVSLLPQMSCLLTWVCSYRPSGELPSFPSQHLSNLHLRTLMIHASNRKVYHVFFDTTSLQGLQQLWVDGFNGYIKVLSWSRNLHTSAVAFLTRSACKLRTLCIVNVWISTEHIAELLSFMPALVDLHLGIQNEDVLDNPLVDLLCIFPGQTPISPSLQHLTFYGGVQFSIARFVRMIYSRIYRNEAVVPITAALESVTVYSGWTTSMVEQLRELESISLVGLKINVENPKESVLPPWEWDNPIDV